jgi:hypothetical protein
MWRRRKNPHRRLRILKKTLNKWNPTSPGGKGHTKKNTSWV